MLLRPRDSVLFLGDSITDAGSRPKGGPQGLGGGYARIVAERLAGAFPHWDLQFANRGISGHRVYDMEKRLDAPEVRSLSPTLVSILIGINDTWRRYDQGLPSPAMQFRASLRRAVGVLRERWNPRLVILEPFVLPVPPDRRKWREDLDPRIRAVREVAVEAGARYVPLDGLFAAAACRRPAACWLPDGVHPSPAGHALVADAWISCVTAE
jgi:lysophospholipase L1-like esterase